MSSPRAMRARCLPLLALAVSCGAIPGLTDAPPQARYVSLQPAIGPDGGRSRAAAVAEPQIELLWGDTLVLGAFSCALVERSSPSMPRATCDAVDARWFWSATEPVVSDLRHRLVLRPSDRLTQSVIPPSGLPEMGVMAAAADHYNGRLRWTIYPWRAVRFTADSLVVRVGQTAVIPYVAENRDGDIVRALSALPTLRDVTLQGPTRTTVVLQRGTVFRVGELHAWSDTTFVTGIREGADSLQFTAAGRLLTIRVRVTP